jgi:putative endopeptidase
MDLAVRPATTLPLRQRRLIRGRAMPRRQEQYDAFDQVREQNRARLRELFESLAAVSATAAKGTAAQKVGDFYAMAIDEARIESLGATPLNADLGRIAGAADLAAIQDLIAGCHRENFPVLFGAGVEVDLMNSKAYAYYLAQSVACPTATTTPPRRRRRAQSCASNTWPT